MDPHVGAASVPLLVDVVCLTVLLLGPVPWCVGYASIESVPPPFMLLALLVGWCLVEMTIALVLGVSGAFQLGPLMIAEGIVFLTGLLVTRRRLRAPLSGVASLPDAWTMRALLAGTAVVGASLLIRLATTPTTDYDSLAYHLPVMARWYQSHRFTMLEQFYDGPVQLSRYPYGWEALAATFLMPFGNDFVVALPNLVAWLLFGVGIHVVAVRVGARPLAALAFTLLALTTPIAREHVETMHVDLALGAFFMAGVALALVPAVTPVTMALFVATLGMLAGAKTSGLVYAVLLVATLAWIRVTERTRWTLRRADSGTRVLAGVAVLAGCLCGLFWYARNLVETGNPLGFVHVTIGGFTLFPGPLEQGTIAATTVWKQFHVTDAAHWGIVLGQAWKRLGAPFVCALIGAVALRAFAVRPATDAVPRGRHLLLAGLVAACAVAYAMTPVSATDWRLGPMTEWMGQAMRYAFPLFGLLAVAGALAVSGTRLPDEMVVPVVIVAALVRASSWALAPAGGLLLFGWAAHRTTRRLPGCARRLTVACLVAAVALPGLRLLQGTRDVARARVYRGLPGFMDGAAGSGLVGYVWSHQSYLFYGTHFDRPVAWVPARGQDREQWIEALRARGVRLVAMGPLRPEWRQRREVGWIEDPDGTFTPVFGYDPTREPVVYRLDTRGR